VNIYLVNQSCGPLFVDIANAVELSYKNVYLITGQVNVLQIQINYNIKIIQSIPYKRNSSCKRLFTWFVFTLHFLVYAIFRTKQSVWLISTNPPFAPWVVPLIKLKKQKVILLVYDLYPEILADAGILKTKSIFYQLWHKMTQITYDYSDHIISIGKTMTDYLLQQYQGIEHKMSTIPNWNVIRFEDVLSSSISPQYKKQRGAENKLHIMYSGNLGISHDFNTILEVAQTSQSNTKLVFTIIGEGVQKKSLSHAIESRGLNNIVLNGFKAPEDVPDAFLSADVFIVTLGSGVEKASIPSKTYDALAAGSALLVIAPKGSELELLINEGGCGKCFEPFDVEGVKNYLEQLADNTEVLSRYKKAAKQLSLKYSPDNAYKYVEILKNV